MLLLAVGLLLAGKQVGTEPHPVVQRLSFFAQSLLVRRGLGPFVQHRVRLSRLDPVLLAHFFLAHLEEVINLLLASPLYPPRLN